MKLIYPLFVVTGLVFLGLFVLIHLKLNALEQRVESRPTAREVEDRMGVLSRKDDQLQAGLQEVYSNLSGRIDALETGAVNQPVHGPQSADFLLTELERQIHLKRDAQFVPEEEMAAQKKIEGIVERLEALERSEGGVMPRLVERTLVSRDPQVRAALIRDVSWRLGPGAVPELLNLFRDREFTSNLRVLAAQACLRAGGDEAALLEEFSKHLGDAKEFMVVRTGLIPLFRDHPFEGAVDLLLDGARNPGYPLQHRTECLLALARYDHPRVIRALEEILAGEEEESYVKNFSIQAYHAILGDKAVPFFTRLVEAGQVDAGNRMKIEKILQKYAN